MPTDSEVPDMFITTKTKEEEDQTYADTDT